MDEALLFTALECDDLRQCDQSNQLCNGEELLKTQSLSPLADLKLSFEKQGVLGY